MSLCAIHNLLEPCFECDKTPIDEMTAPAQTARTDGLPGDMPPGTIYLLNFSGGLLKYEFVSAESYRQQANELAAAQAELTALRASVGEPVAWVTTITSGNVQWKEYTSDAPTEFRKNMWGSAGKQFTITPLYALRPCTDGGEGGK